MVILSSDYQCSGSILYNINELTIPRTTCNYALHVIQSVHTINMLYHSVFLGKLNLVCISYTI